MSANQNPPAGAEMDSLTPNSTVQVMHEVGHDGGSLHVDPPSLRPPSSPRHERGLALRDEYFRTKPVMTPTQGRCARFTHFFHRGFDVYVRLHATPWQTRWRTGDVRQGALQEANFADLKRNKHEFDAPRSEKMTLCCNVWDKHAVKDHKIGHCKMSLEPAYEAKNEMVTLTGVLLRGGEGEEAFAGDLICEARFDGQKLSVRVLRCENLVDHFERKDVGTSRLVLACSAVVAVYLVIGCAFFMSEKGWNVPQALFFCVLTITTVGYGTGYNNDNVNILDHPDMMVFLCFYILVGIGLIGGALGIVGEYIITRLARAPSAFASEHDDDDENDMKVAMDGNSCRVRSAACFTSIPSSCWLFLVMLLVGTIFYGLVPGTGDDASPPWTFLQAFYFCVVSMTTIGYGDLVPQTPLGQWFGCLWLLLATLITAKCVGDLLDIYLDYRAAKLRKDILEHAFKTEADITYFDSDGDGTITELEWTTKMLLKLKLVSEDNLESIHHRFKLMDSDGSGKISLEELRRVFKLGRYIDPNYVPPAQQGALTKLVNKVEDSIGDVSDANAVGGLQNRYKH